MTSSEAQPHASPARFPGFILAIAGLFSVFMGPVVYMMFMDSSFLRSSGLLMWVLMLDGVVLSLLAMAKDARKRVRVIGGINMALVLLSVVGFFGLSKLPETTLARLEVAPDFTLPDDAGKSTSLKELLRSGPVLLVFYRGPW